jgi:beta-lactam-binding protein with PASTA domain
MPNLVEGSLKNAEAVLKSYELVRGKVLWQPDPAFNAVLEQRYEGKVVDAGKLIPKGSVIDLVIGDGRGKVTWRLDDLRGNNLNDTKIYLLGAGLELGDVTYDIDSMDRSGVVIKQIPAPGRTVRMGQQVDIWIGSADSLKTNQVIDAELEQQSEDD